MFHFVQAYYNKIIYFGYIIYIKLKVVILLCFVMDNKTALVVFENKDIRRIWNNNEWYFVLDDIIVALTESKDPKQYIKRVRSRDLILAQGWVQIVPTLFVDTPGGKQKMNCVNTLGAFRIIQSIPSLKAEPFKRWLAQVGYERIQEIENPELAQDRAKEYYELKGYPKDWINKRLRGITIRQELTDECKNRKIKQETDFAILTNEICKATFDKTVQEYKKYKKLSQKKNVNLRDHMTDWELILTMFGEKATTDITKTRNSKGFDECKNSAKRGGEIAFNARKELEQEIKQSVVSNQNFLNLNIKNGLTNKIKKKK